MALKLRMENSLDLRSGGLLSIELAKELTKITHSVRDEYTDYIGRLAQSNSLTGLDWLVNVTCRNPYQTKIFDNLCKLRLLESCLDNNLQLNTVIVEDQGMYEAVYALCRKHGANFTVKFEITGGSPIQSRLIHLLRRVAILVYISLISFVIPILLKKKKIIPDHSIIYLDMFAKVSDFDENGDFIDRHYPGLLQTLDQSQADKVWYAPILSIRAPDDLKLFINGVERSNNRFLIMEQWLNASDYLFAFFQSFKLPRRIKKVPDYCGVNISTIILRESVLDIFSAGIFDSLLRYRFFQRLKESGIKIDKVIDWSENQVIDRALCLGVRSFYPSVRIIGYQGFIVSEYYVSHEPSWYEREAGTTPDVICVMNEALVSRKKKYCPDQKIVVAPAFRFMNLMNYHSIVDSVRDIILLALPVHIDTSRMIIQLCLRVYEDFNYKFQIKLHPTVTKKKFLVEVPEASDSRFKFVEDSLYNLFPDTALLVSSDSSACFEAIYCGVSVIIIGNRTGPTFSPLDGIVSSEYWDVCYDTDCLLKMLATTDQSFKINRDMQLMPVTKESAKEFIAL